MKSAAAVIGLFAAILAAGCGEETTFSAAEFVERANDEGAGLELREQLFSTSDQVEVWAVSLTGASTDAVGGGDLAHGGGSLAVASDSDRGHDEFARCEQSVTLVCFRAANVVLRLEGATPEEVAQIEAAIKAIGSG